MIENFHCDRFVCSHDTVWVESRFRSLCLCEILRSVEVLLASFGGPATMSPPMAAGAKSLRSNRILFLAFEPETHEQCMDTDDGDDDCRLVLYK